MPLKSLKPLMKEPVLDVPEEPAGLPAMGRKPGLLKRKPAMKGPMASTEVKPMAGLMKKLIGR